MILVRRWQPAGTIVIEKVAVVWNCYVDPFLACHRFSAISSDLGPISHSSTGFLTNASSVEWRSQERDQCFVKNWIIATIAFVLVMQTVSFLSTSKKSVYKLFTHPPHC